MTAGASTATAAPPIEGLVEDALRGRLVLPMIPGVVRRVITMLGQPFISTAALSQELSQDPVLCARVLRLANSPFYGGRESIASIDAAIAAIGPHPLGTLLVTSGVNAAFEDVPGVHMRDFWLHATVSAMAARALAEQAGADPEAAFLGGLLHEAGHLILCRARPTEAVAHFGDRISLHGEALADAEQRAFGVSHAVVSALWCRSLALPGQVGDAVATYLRPDLADGQDIAAMATLINLASVLATAVAHDDSAEEAAARLAQHLPTRGQFDPAIFGRGGAFADHYRRWRDAGAYCMNGAMA